MRYHVWVIIPGRADYAHEDTGGYIYVCTCTGDIGEIVAACQVLFPDMTSVAVEAADDEAIS